MKKLIAMVLFLSWPLVLFRLILVVRIQMGVMLVLSHITVTKEK